MLIRLFVSKLRSLALISRNFPFQCRDITLFEVIIIPKDKKRKKLSVLILLTDDA